MNITDSMIDGLPDQEAARRFLTVLEEKKPAAYARIVKNKGLLSDVLTLVSFSPLLAATLLQHPEYFWWLERKRTESGVRSTEELLESLARYSFTNSQLAPQVQFARFRRRELSRIYLRDIRRLATVPEITEELSNLADAILESAIDLAGREMDNRFGRPQHEDTKGRQLPTAFCIVALGKLGSRELNYSSDIDLLFIYSNDGQTSGTGTRGAVTNREYYTKLAEFIVKLVGEQTGEGAAYRVDLRLRPHGSLGALAVSVDDMVRYYQNEARNWERQVMIRSRGCAGDIGLFKNFFGRIEALVFDRYETIDGALANVRLSKEKIDIAEPNRGGFNVKLGRGGIREIEFLAQALQLAYGGRDAWLRSPHTLISLTRLADRGHLSEKELTDLSAAYEFLRRTEHVLQMENGLQTHTVPDDPAKRVSVAKKVTFTSGSDFDTELTSHTTIVNRIFKRAFGHKGDDQGKPGTVSSNILTDQDRLRTHIMESIDRSDLGRQPASKNNEVLARLTSVSPHFAAMLAADPSLVSELANPSASFVIPDYGAQMLTAASTVSDLGEKLSILRRLKSRFLLEIVVMDIFGVISMAESKSLQALLAEASINAAIQTVRDELLAERATGDQKMDLSALALGKLGGRSLDYDSDLDLILAYNDPEPSFLGITASEFYSRAAEMIVNVLSSMTRDGNLYRVDLRLRPYGSKGLSAISGRAFIEYMQNTAEIWEMLAYVKIRAAGGDPGFGVGLENEIRHIIHQRAASIEPAKLRDETIRVRMALEKQRSRTRRGGQVDIKYGSGGLLDVYFSMRYLQLRDNVPDDPKDRSTDHMLCVLHERGSLSVGPYTALSDGYSFLSVLDHNIRLTVGRTKIVPIGNRSALETIAERMHVASVTELDQQLAAHRLMVRKAFQELVQADL